MAKPYSPLEKRADDDGNETPDALVWKPAPITTEADTAGDTKYVLLAAAVVLLHLCVSVHNLSQLALPHHHLGRCGAAWQSGCSC